MGGLEKPESRARSPYIHTQARSRLRSEGDIYFKRKLGIRDELRVVRKFLLEYTQSEQLYLGKYSPYILFHIVS